MDKTVTFPAQIFKVQTMQDYGIRVTLDLPETCIMQTAELMECKRAGVPLLVSVTIGEAEDEVTKLIRNAH